MRLLLGLRIGPLAFGVLWWYASLRRVSSHGTCMSCSMLKKRRIMDAKKNMEYKYIGVFTCGM